MAERQPPHAVRFALSIQHWRDVTFLHWRLDPDRVAPMLPERVEPDLWDGAAWVSLTPLEMRAVRAPGLPPLPGVSTFPETNLRTYVRSVEDGSDGLVFLSVECAQPLAVAALRLLNLPYRRSRMSIQREGRRISYRSRRRPPGPRPRSRTDVRVGAPLSERERSPLDVWLSGRWHAYTAIGGRIARVPVAHQPWPLRRAELLDFDDELLPAAGLEGLGEPRLVRFSPGVDVRVGPPRPGGVATS